jgi:hypothetical protein
MAIRVAVLMVVVTLGLTAGFLVTAQPARAGGVPFDARAATGAGSAPSPGSDALENAAFLWLYGVLSMPCLALFVGRLTSIERRAGQPGKTSWSFWLGGAAFLSLLAVPFLMMVFSCIYFTQATTDRHRLLINWGINFWTVLSAIGMAVFVGAYMGAGRRLGIAKGRRETPPPPPSFKADTEKP